MSLQIPLLDTMKHAAVPSGSSGPRATVETVRLLDLRHAIEHAAHLLPAQGPITVFIHHNTLHAFEDLPFEEAVKKGAKTFGCRAYLPEDRFREELARGRIRFGDLMGALQEDLGQRADDRVAGLVPLLDLRLAMLQHPLRHGPTEELLWFIAETDALRRCSADVSPASRRRLVSETRHWVMRDLRGGNEFGPNGNHSLHGPDVDLAAIFGRFKQDHIEQWSEDTWEAFALQALWRLCCSAAAQTPDHGQSAATTIRHRDLLLQATGTDSDGLVHDLLIPFCAAFLDQGLAHWQLPDRDKGFYRAFCNLYGDTATPDAWLRAVGVEVARLNREDVGPLESIRQSLELLGVAETEWDDFLSATLLALPGWAGMVRQVELRSDRVVRPVPAESLIEFLAVRLLLERFALAAIGRETLSFTGPLSMLRQSVLQRIGKRASLTVEQRAFQVFQLAQVLGWPPAALYGLTVHQWSDLLRHIEEFNGLERCRIFHLAYERRFVIQALDAVILHEPRRQASARPRFQAVFCLDEREESMRRHLEEAAPDVETFGVAGFYGVAMYYRGAADAHFVPLCPIVLRPQHWVTEQVLDAQAEAHARRARARWALGTASHHFHRGSRTFVLGALLTAGLGVLASIPLVARVLFPRLTAQVRRILGRFVQAPPATRLKLERCAPQPGPDNGQQGYSIEEMSTIAEKQLRDIGLTRNFARLVLLLGHGSSSLNNPHRSAYDCGACGGSPGAPNARALAQILNDVRIRERLAQRGLTVPPDTVFVGGFHNTCIDAVTLFDLEDAPASHATELATAVQDIETALTRNAHERCRRFMSAPLTLSVAAARQHVEARSEDLAQTRPELGHATNAICFVGRRQRTRGLFLDRRAFLTSYDPTHDDAEGTILTRLLQAAVPVCAGINLEYYFSRVDSPGWGCGTKLPHNVTALLGVMDGAASDLRTGLPWQMVEIHEPVRLLFIIETSPAVMLGIMERQPSIGKLLKNGWALLVVLDPELQAMNVYRDGVFHDYAPEADQLPKATSSVNWYRGWRDHLEFAEIEA